MTAFGVDSSNYRSSAAVIGEDLKYISNRKLLPVKLGECGLRQSDAVFAHTRQLPDIVTSVLSNTDLSKLKAVGYSFAPRRVEGSYMPCFLVGEGLAKIVGASLGVPAMAFSHQEGHIGAALISANRLDLMDKPFIAFHLSGGTTEAVLVKPAKVGFETEIIAKTLDISVGQVIDRVAVMLGLGFPGGEELEKMAVLGESIKKPVPSIKGKDCALSGVQNICENLYKKGESKENVAFTALEYVSATVLKMTESILKDYGNLPLVYSGGVMANNKLRKDILSKFDADFASPQLSGDNAVGIAYLALKTLEI